MSESKTTGERTSRPPQRSIDPARLPKHFDAPEVETRWDEIWEREGVYHYDPARPREETFVVDTPPVETLLQHLNSVRRSYQAAYKHQFLPTSS